MASNNVVENAFRVYVGNLAWTVNSQDLEDHMAAIGGVVHAEVMQLSDGRSKGCGVVTFDNELSSQRAIQEMIDTNLKGRNIWLREFREESNGYRPPKQISSPAGLGEAQSPSKDALGAPDACQVHVGNLPWSITSEQLLELCTEFGDIQSADVAINHAGRSRGYGLVIFASETDAEACIEGLHGTFCEGRDLTVRVSVPSYKRTRGPKRQEFPAKAPSMTSGYNVYVGNLPWSCKMQDLKDMVQEYGETEFVDLASDRNGRSRGFGIVSFKDLENAYNCMRSMNGLEVDGRALRVKEDSKSPLPTFN